jgi:hypothetical protein
VAVTFLCLLTEIKRVGGKIKEKEKRKGINTHSKFNSFEKESDLTIHSVIFRYYVHLSIAPRMPSMYTVSVCQCAEVNMNSWTHLNSCQSHKNM